MSHTEAFRGANGAFLVRRLATAFVVACVFLATGVARAQESKPHDGVKRQPPTLSEVLALHEAGFGASEFQKLFESKGEPVFSVDEVERLREARLPASIVDRLAEAAARAAPKALSFDELKALVASGLDERALVALIEGSNGPLATADQILDLLRLGASASVIRAVRAKSAERPESRASTSRTPAPTLEDLPRLVQLGYSTESIVRRILETDARFDVDGVKLVELMRSGVNPEILKTVWARRRTGDEGTAPAAAIVPPKDAPGSTTEAASKPAQNDGAAADAERTASATNVLAPPGIDFHDDPSLGFAILSPQGFELRRDARNGNALTSFVKGEPTHPDGLADAELAVFTYRSSAPERLVESNLGPVGENFLARLGASYAARKISVDFGAREPRRLAGRAAMRSRLAAAGPDGATHVGEIWWVFVGERTFVVSTAVRAEHATIYSEVLSRCLRSFAPIERKPRPTSSGDDRARAAEAASAWRDAVLNRDFALFDALHSKPSRDRARLETFSKLCDRFDDPAKRFVTGPVDVLKDGAVTEFRLLGGSEPVPHAVRWAKIGDDFVLRE
jgi:hypothetical protein